MRFLTVNLLVYNIYLSGYVIHRLHKQIKNSKRWNSSESQYCIAILEAARETDTDYQSNQKLVSALNRGGLFHVSKDVQQIFVITEKYCLRKTGGKPNPSVKINKLILDISWIFLHSRFVYKNCKQG